MTNARAQRFWAVIPAAGLGKRFGGTQSKIYLEVEGTTLIERVIHVFLSLPEIAGVIVALHPDDQQFQTLSVSTQSRVHVVQGGEARCDSVWSALQCLQTMAAENDWVMVHDAARPFLKGSVLTRMITVLQNHPVGGILALPVVDTLKRVNTGGEIVDTVSREHLWRAQTPQMFRYQVLCEALAFVREKGHVVTDDAQAVSLLGRPVTVVEGDPDNRKITFPEDWSES